MQFCITFNKPEKNKVGKLPQLRLYKMYVRSALSLGTNWVPKKLFLAKKWVST